MFWWSDCQLRRAFSLGCLKGQGGKAQAKGQKRPGFTVRYPGAWISGSPLVQGELGIVWGSVRLNVFIT